MCSNIMPFRASFNTRNLIICALSVQNEFLYLMAKGAVVGTFWKGIACCYESLAGVVISTVDIGGMMG